MRSPRPLAALLFGALLVVATGSALPAGAGDTSQPVVAFESATSTAVTAVAVIAAPTLAHAVRPTITWAVLVAGLALVTAAAGYLVAQRRRVNRTPFRFPAPRLRGPPAAYATIASVP
jgi:hypothetical protein